MGPVDSSCSWLVRAVVCIKGIINIKLVATVRFCNHYSGTSETDSYSGTGLAAFWKFMLHKTN